jgi:hypothetical protein
VFTNDGSERFKEIEFAYYFGCVDETAVCTSVLVERLPENEEPICINNTPDNIAKFQREVETKLSQTKAPSQRVPVAASTAVNEHVNSRKISLANVCFRHEHGYAFSYALTEYAIITGKANYPSDVERAIRYNDKAGINAYEDYIISNARLRYSDPTSPLFDKVEKDRERFVSEYLKPAFNKVAVRGLTGKQMTPSQADSVSRSLYAFMSSCVRCSREGAGKLYTAIGCVPVGSVTEFIRDVVMTVMLGIAGAYCLFCIIVSAITLQTSQGDSKQIEAARARLIQCVGGLLIAIFATLILRIVAVDVLRIPFIR